MSRSSTTDFGDAITDRLPRPVPPFARAPVLVLAALVTALLVALSPRYDLVTDELYFLAAGKFHPAWGYMDQQPLVPLLAAFLDTAFPGSLVAFRLPAALVTALGMVVTALIAREFGGNRRAQ
ncbi:glycosyl transferase, partial [Saccharopolyspora kobensis]